MGAFLQWLDEWARLILPSMAIAGFGLWLKRANSNEHSQVADSLNELTGSVGELRGELSTYIREHAKVHERLPY